MKRHASLIIPALFIIVTVAGGVIGQRVTYLRESEAFYRWIFAAATNVRLDWQNAGEEHKDDVLFADTNAACMAAAQDGFRDESGQAVTALSQAVANPGNDALLWQLVSGPTLEKQRAEFLLYARDRKLLYAKDIQYAEAQASGVSVFNLFFGFRKMAANFVWLQVDRYWHTGLVFRMVPMMNTCVALDPNFVDAYLIGAWHLAYNVTAKMMDTPYELREWDAKYNACVGEKERYYYWAVDFLEKGIRNNPRNYKLYFDLGFAVYKNKLKDYANAVKYLSEAVRVPHDRWVPRQLFICQELNGQYTEAYQGWEKYMSMFPESQTAQEVAPRFMLRNQGLIAEKESLDDEKAAEAATGAESDALRAKAAEARDKAVAIYSQMNDPFGEFRKAIIQARELRREKRYLEAIAYLDKARWDYPAEFDEAANMMIDIKLEAGIPLSVSEQKEHLRQQSGQICKGMPAK